MISEIGEASQLLGGSEKETVEDPLVAIGLNLSLKESMALKLYLADIDLPPERIGTQRSGMADKEARRLAEVIQQGIKAQEALKERDVDREELLLGWIEEGEKAQLQLVSEYLPLVVNKAVRSYLALTEDSDRRTRLSLLDLVQAGNLALTEAVVKYREEQRTVAFSIFVAGQIERGMRKEIREQAWPFVLPPRIVGQYQVFETKAEELERRQGETPVLAEVLDEVQLTREERRKFEVNLPLLGALYFLDRGRVSFARGGEHPLAALFKIREADYDPEVVILKIALQGELERVLGMLRLREEGILRMRFGLTSDGRSYTLEETGEKYGVTGERIRQIENKALRRVRHPVRTRRLRELFRS